MTKTHERSDIANLREIIILVSHPRSGNSFTRYILESITGYPSMGYAGVDAESFVNSNFSAEAEGVIVKRHGDIFDRIKEHIGLVLQQTLQLVEAENLSTWNRPVHQNSLYQYDDRVKFILILRNPVESLLRHKGPCDNGHWPNSLPDWLGGNTPLAAQARSDHHQSHYFQNIEDFLRIDEDRRCIITYEQLVQNPRAYITKLHDFVDAPIKDIDSFMADFDSHWSRARSIYTGKVGQPALSSGKEVDVYAKSKPEMVQEIWDRIETYVTLEVNKFLIDLYKKPEN